MGKIPVSQDVADAIHELLKAAGTGAELVGPDGETLGAFVSPSVLPEVQIMLERRRAAIDVAIAAISTEELDAIAAEGGGIPHEEVVSRLGLPGCSASSGCPARSTA